MYLDTTKDHLYWAVDIEGDPIPSTRVWCLCAVNLSSKEEIRLRDYDEIKSWIKERKREGSKFIFHNGLGYDGPTLNRVVKTNLSVNDIIDTLVMSMLYSPSLKGGHGLGDWGVRLKFPKIEFNDFSKWSQEQEDYCMNDAKLCLRVYVALRARMLQIGFTEAGLELEHKSWALIKKQQDNGFYFNAEEAHKLYSLLREKENEIRDRIYEYWPPKLERVGTFKRPYKKDGQPTENFKRHREQYVDIQVSEDGTEYHAIDYVYFVIGSPKQRVEKLLELGWVPREFTKKTDKGGGGQPQPTKKGQLSPSLQEFVDESGSEEVKLIAKWIEINARANMVNTWLEAYNEPTRCIHGGLWLANTLRYRHSNPNTANIPAVRSNGSNILRGEDGVFTYEARDLWTIRSSDRCLVGVDAKGIQLRVLAHYLNNPKFTEAVLDGDPHSYNQEVGGFKSRGVAKTFIYAFLLGSGDELTGQIIGGTAKDGREIKKRFIGNFPGLSNLLDDLERQVERTGRIILCDGTPVGVDRPHTRLGYLLQGDESRIMKKAAVFAAAEIKRRSLDVLKVGDIHDEWQNDVHLRNAKEFAYDVCPEVFRRAGESFNYRLPVDCDARIGFTWADTH